MCIRSFLLRRLGCCVTRVPLMPSRADVKKTQRHDKKRKLTTKPKRFQICMSTCMSPKNAAVVVAGNWGQHHLHVKKSVSCVCSELSFVVTPHTAPFEHEDPLAFNSKGLADAMLCMSASNSPPDCSGFTFVTTNVKRSNDVTTVLATVQSVIQPSPQLLQE